MKQEKGKTILDLVKLIDEKVKNKEVLFRINEVLLDTLGRDFEKTFEHYFDYQLAIDSLAFFDSEIVPKIDASSIKQEISNIHFDCDLSKIQETKKIKTNSFLHKALFKS